MDSIKQKLSEKGPTPAEAAAMDASIRQSRRSEGVKRMVGEIQALQRAGLTPQEITDLPGMSDWKLEYPKLFEMVVQSRARSQELLNAMLAQLEAVEAGVKTTHDASVVVGTVLVNTYVRPTLGMGPVPLPNSAQPPARP
jgi:predicted RNA-binding protein with EMAP domain